MKQEDKQYEKWLTEVKSNQPILENPEELTATILNRISGIYLIHFITYVLSGKVQGTFYLFGR